MLYTCDVPPPTPLFPPAPPTLQLSVCPALPLRSRLSGTFLPPNPPPRPAFTPPRVCFGNRVDLCIGVTANVQAQGIVLSCVSESSWLRQLTDKILQVAIPRLLKTRTMLPSVRMYLVVRPPSPKLNVGSHAECRDQQNYFCSKAHPISVVLGSRINLELRGKGRGVER